jgi:hypothetical protein
LRSRSWSGSGWRPESPHGLHYYFARIPVIRW